MKRIFTAWITAAVLLAASACSAAATETTDRINGSQTADPATANTAPVASSAASVADALSGKIATHENPADYTWDAGSVIRILFNGDAILAEGAGVTIEGSSATITAAGTYSLSGSLSDGRLIVDTDDEETVRLILEGADLLSTTSAPIYIRKAAKAVIILADNTSNSVTDGAAYTVVEPDSDEPNAAIFSTADLTIAGNGALTVTANYNDGIAGKDGLLIHSGTITVTAMDDGLRGKDYLVILGGSLRISARGDGLKSDNTDDPQKGYIAIDAGTLAVDAGGDAIQAQSDVLIAGGEFILAAGGGSGNRTAETASAKGICAAANINIDGGTFSIDSADDAVNANGSVTVNGGAFEIRTGDDGMHADATLTVNGGDIQITESYEGLESAVITIQAGTIRITAGDDAINVAGGKDGSGMNPGMGPGGRPGGRPGKDSFAAAGNYFLRIHGGYLAITAGGDGIDVNGTIEMTGGMVLVNGPTENMNGALDYDGGFTITGGILIAAGSSGMAQAPGESSSQYSILLNFTNRQAGGTMVHIQDGNGANILSFIPARDFQSIVFSSPDLQAGGSYEIYTGGSSTGAFQDGRYTDGVYTPGTAYTSFTISGKVTRIGEGARAPR
ncbi:MAG: carbohydrate-binding domain-containing protein [Anaerolineales bacterium]|nr:carbohydrate-binding domain-containing protein [Anaerolineales bacterium]